MGFKKPNNKKTPGMSVSRNYLFKVKILFLRKPHHPSLMSGSWVLTLGCYLLWGNLALHLCLSRVFSWRELVSLQYTRQGKRHKARFLAGFSTEAQETQV